MKLESDPLGKAPNEPGAKLDAGKLRMGLVLQGFARALKEVARVGTHGAAKYSDNGWMSVPNGEVRYTDALYRHLMEEAAGHVVDDDTNLFHAAQTAWNALARLDLMLRRMEDKHDNIPVAKAIVQSLDYQTTTGRITPGTPGPTEVADPFAAAK